MNAQCIRNKYATVLHNKHKPYFLLNIGLIALFLIDLFLVKIHLDENTSLIKLIWGEKNGYFVGFDYIKDPGIWAYLFDSFYAALPSFEWVPAIILILSFTSIALILNLALTAILQTTGQKTPYVLLLCVLIVLLNENLVWIHHTRAAFLMCGSSILIALFLYARPSFRLRKFWYFLSLMWFVGGMLLRPETALGSLMMMGLGVLLFFGKNVRASFNTLGPHILFLLSLGCYYIYHVANNTNYYYKLEPDVEYEMMDRNNIIPLSEMKNAKDSVKYEAIVHFWSQGDFTKTTPEFTRSLLNKPDDLVHRLFFFAFPPNTPQEKHEKRYEGFPFLLSDIGVFLFCLIIAGLSLFLYGKRTGSFTTFYILASITLILFTFSINRYGRIVDPLTGLLCSLGLFSLLLNFPTGRKAFSRVFLLFIGLFLAGYTYVRFAETVKLSKKYTFVETRTTHAVDSLMRSSSRKYVYLTPTFSTFEMSPFKPFHEFPNKQLIITEFAQYSVHKPFLKRLSEITGCEESDYLCRFQFLKTHEKDLIIISHEERLAFIDKYLRTMYGFETGFSKKPSTPLYDDVRVWMP